MDNSGTKNDDLINRYVPHIIKQAFRCFLLVEIYAGTIYRAIKGEGIVTKVTLIFKNKTKSGI